jgi:capsular polysaccharide biosynthesis protein
LVVGVLASVASVTLVTPPPTPYEATFKLAVRPRAEPASERFYTYDEYYAYVASEYLNDDVIDFIDSNTFVARTQELLKRSGDEVVEGSFRAKKAHRVMTVTATSGTASGALSLASAARDLLSNPESEDSIFSLISRQRPRVTVLQDPIIVSSPGESRMVAELGLRLLVVLVLAIGVPFLIYEVDDTVRTTAEAQKTLGKLPILTEVPRPARWGG